ncbi:SpoIIE family protein phosphatase [Streptomyces sp. ActVer]|uniref:ATP-binding SpoIIE family protein phosphatase n=1 Tax=Streptomyces sp. ActVer TaxID=3014558 RepID=UPI0022B4127B|nr:ATP-binding SpoIIE family protein phosphatase [Streptomyces sp. ActVer]MCZ4511859.1 SpoIIE family protein phosphatase [Streptomyces sp. ActVer]
MSRAPEAPDRPRAVARTSLPGNPLAPGAARRFVRTALAEWTELALPGAEFITDLLVADAMVVVSELVTNAVVHAGTDVELLCRLGRCSEDCPAAAASDSRAVRTAASYEDSGHDEGAGNDSRPGPVPDSGVLVIEVSDHHPARVVRDDGAEQPYDTVEYGRGLHLVAALSEAWGITYRTGVKTVWARLPVDGGATVEEEAEAYDGEHALRRGQRAAEILAPAPRRGMQDQDWRSRGVLSFLAEASDLLAGQLDEDLVAALTGQLLVPRLADWCAVWLEDEAPGRSDGGVVGGPRLARVWHGSENRIEELRRLLEKDPPELPESDRAGPVPVPWPAEALGARATGGSALAFRLIAGGRPLGTLVIGRAGQTRFPDEITGPVEDLSRRVALAIGAARQYARQATISRVLQRGLLPGAVAEIPGVRSALVYEPCDKGGPSGDFYDLFPAGDGRWCFALGDVQGKGPEAAVVIGLARPWLRLLAREGYEVPDVLDRLNQLLLDDATEASDAAARALVSAGGTGLADEGPQTRFLSLLYGELVPFEGGVHCTVASAGHPLPLLLQPSGEVGEVAQPQTLLGVFEDASYLCGTFELRPGDSLLCVTDGVTERRSGHRQFDDDDGLAAALTGCAGLSAELIAERIRRLVHEFGGKPPEDDLALLVLQAE